MDARKKYILLALLRSYILSAEPIGSRTLKRTYGMQFSPATIRNEMSDLEHLGFLMKAHTSSGRIPSQRAYRWYVDHLLSNDFIDQRFDIALSDRSLLTSSTDLVNIIESSVEMLSEMTNEIAFATIPKRGEDRFRKIEILSLSAREILIVFVYKSRLVRTRLIHLQDECQKERIERIANILQRLLEDKSVFEAKILFQEDLNNSEFMRNSIFHDVIKTVIEEIHIGMEPDLLIKGQDKLFRNEEYAKNVDLDDFVTALFDVEKWRDLLSVSKDGVQVFIGDESNIDIFKNCSFIFASFRICGTLQGTIGVLAPTRTDYRKAISDVQKMSRYIDSVANRQG